MKKTFLFLALAGLILSGCSKTWSGIKQDSHEIWIDTKDAIHEATAPSEEVIANKLNTQSDSSKRMVDVSNNVVSVEQNMTRVQKKMDSSK